MSSVCWYSTAPLRFSYGIWRSNDLAFHDAPKHTRLCPLRTRLQRHAGKLFDQPAINASPQARRRRRASSRGWHAPHEQLSAPRLRSRARNASQRTVNSRARRSQLLRWTLDQKKPWPVTGKRMRRRQDMRSAPVGPAGGVSNVHTDRGVSSRGQPVEALHTDRNRRPSQQEHAFSQHTRTHTRALRIADASESRA